MDGDGCLDSPESEKYLRCRICSGSDIFLESIIDRLKDYKIINKNLKAKVHKAKNSECYTFTLRHYDSISICKYVYENANLLLKRKYNKFNNVIFSKTN